MFGRLVEFLKDARVELSKITWPTRDELKGSTTVVIVSVILITIFIGVVDQVFNFLLKYLVKAI